MQQMTALGTTTASLVGPPNIQLLVLDIDGTIAGKSNQIRQPVQKAIRAAQAKGVQVAIATGRMYRSALRFHEGVSSHLPLIAYQGALIRDPATHHTHRHWTLSQQTARQLLEHLERVEYQLLEHLERVEYLLELSVHFYIHDQLYVRTLTPETEIYAQRSEVEPIPVGDLRQMLDQKPTKVLALSDNQTLIDHLLTDLRQRYTPAELYLTKSVATFFEATNPLVNKGTAVQYLTEEILGLQATNVMTIGDNLNDQEMLEYAGIGVAMGNAPEAVKAVADWVAPDVELDGAAVAIEQFIL